MSERGPQAGLAAPAGLAATVTGAAMAAGGSALASTILSLAGIMSTTKAVFIASGVVALLALYPLRLTADRLVATDIAHALPVTLVAALGHASLGHLNLSILACLLLGSVPGVLIASRIVIRIPPTVTRTLIAIVLAFVSARMLKTV